MLERAATDRVRKVSTVTGEVSTLSADALLQDEPTDIEVDASGNVWVAVGLPPMPDGEQQQGIVRITPNGAASIALEGICCGYDDDLLEVGDAFHVDEEAGVLYYVHANAPQQDAGSKDWPYLWSIPLGSLPADAPDGTALARFPERVWTYAMDIEPAADGNLYIVAPWSGLVRYDGGPELTEVNTSYVSTNGQGRIAFGRSSSSMYHFRIDGGIGDRMNRRTDFGQGSPTIVAGQTATGGPIDGDPGQLNGPVGLALSPDGRIAYIADADHRRVRRLLLPPDPGELGPNALCGTCNPGMNQVEVPKVADPVDVATGNLTESFTDLVLPGRGREVSASRTYNSLLAGVDGLFGPGWSSPLDTRLFPGSKVVWIRQENGSEISFWRGAGDVMTAPPWVTSTLQKVTGGWRLDRNHGDIVTFDDQGRLTGWEDRNGYVTTVTRPSAAQIVVTTPGGRALTFTVSGGHVTAVSDDSSPARTVDYTYTSGRLTKVESFKVNAADTGRVTWQYGYDPAGRLNAVTDPRGNSNLTHYDALGRVDHQLDHAGALTEITYGGAYPDEWREVEHPAYNAAGQRSTTRYQLDGLLTESITTGHGTASSRTTTYSYDPDTLGVETITGPGSVPLGAFTYDANGNVLTSTDVTGRTTTYAYADLDNPNSPTSVTDPAGNVSSLTYDDAGNLLTTSTPVRLPNGTVQGTAVTTLERTDSAHPEDVTRVVAPDQHGQPVPKKTQISYRAGDGQVSWVQDPEGNRTTFGYDSRGFVTSAVTPRGNASATAGDYETTFVVNDFGMVRSVTDPLGEVSSQLYDGNGNVTFVTDANGQTTTTTYDAMNRPRIVTRPDSSQTETTYFPNGAVRAQVNGLDDDTTYTYDVHGAVASSTDPNGQSTSYRYDALGRLQHRIDPGGACPGATGCTTYGYSATTRELTSVSYSDPATPDITGVGYDALGRRTNLTRSAGAAQGWAWDSLGRQRSGTDVNGRTTTYGWTLGGNLASVTYPGQTTPVTYTYDAADRMKTVTDWAGRQTQIGWTADSQWQTTTFPTGTTNADTRTYDEAGRLASVEWKQGATSLGKLTYDRDPEGLLKSETPTGGTFSTRTWGYDQLDQLDQVDTTDLALDDAGNLTRTEDGTYQTFDPAQQICWTSPTATTGSCTTTAPADATTYDHDTRGNRTAMDAPGPTDWAYGYDQENRMTSAVETGEAPIDDMTAAQAVAGDFDADGKEDVFWYHPGAAQDWATWGADRAEFGLHASPYTVSGTTYEPFTGDFDGDGHDDIFWYAPGTVGDPVWFWFNNGVDDYTQKAFNVNGDYTPIVGDFDGDGFSDVYWYGTGTVADSIWWGNADVDTTSAFTSTTVSRGGAFEAIAADFDGNGSDDIMWYEPGTGTDTVYYGTGTRNSWISRNHTLNGTGWDLAAGDFDGDGEDDLFLYSATASQVWWGTTDVNAFGASLSTWVTLAAGYQLDGGDFDGDGYDDLLAYDPFTTSTAWWGTATRASFGTAAHRGLTPDPNTATYTYDADGLRTAKTVNGTTTQYTWDTAGGLPLLLSQHQGATTTHVVYGPGGTPLYEVTGTTATYYHQDHQGSTRLTTNATGAVVARYAYSAYGDLTTNTAPTTPRPVLSYTGQYTDPETGFIYLRARYMDPKTGQFASRDPLMSFSGTPHGYAGSNPVMSSDPFGLVPECPAGQTYSRENGCQMMGSQTPSSLQPGTVGHHEGLGPDPNEQTQLCDGDEICALVNRWLGKPTGVTVTTLDGALSYALHYAGGSVIVDAARTGSISIKALKPGWASLVSLILGIAIDEAIHGGYIDADTPAPGACGTERYRSYEGVPNYPVRLG